MRERFIKIYGDYKNAIYGYLFYMTQDEQAATGLVSGNVFKNLSWIKEDEG